MPVQIHMKEIKLSVPDDALAALKMNSDQLAAAIKLAASMKLFELGRLSSGAAAKLAGIPRLVFLSKLADYGIQTFRLTREEFDTETRLA